MGRRTICLLPALAIAWLMPIGSAAGSDLINGGSGQMAYREALFYLHQEKHDQAIVRLLMARRQAATIPDEAALMLGNLYAHYGDDAEAGRIFEQIVSGSAGNGIGDQAWFYLAKIRSKKGGWQEAQSALDRIGHSLPENLQAERRLLQAQLHTQNGAYDRALSELAEVPADDPLYSYARFNLGVAMVGARDVNAGAAILGEIGSQRTSTEEERSLRDKANLALGFALLRDGRAEAARETLSRVRLDGPFSNQALLGAGWADADNERYQRALVPWMEIHERNPFDPAVQESMLAIPFAMVKLGALNQAADHYSAAIDTFASASIDIEALVNSVRNGLITDALLNTAHGGETAWHTRRDPVPHLPELRSLYPYLATKVVQDNLQNIRDLDAILDSLNSWQRSVAVFRRALAERELAYEQKWALLHEQLSQSAFDELLERTAGFGKRLDTIAHANEWLALATASEFEMWAEAAAIGSHRSAKAPVSESSELREKVTLLKGVIQWTLDQEFDQRLSRARMAHAGTYESLAELHRKRRVIEQALQQERLAIAEFKARLEVTEPMIGSLQARVESAIAGQRMQTEQMVVNELLAGQKRLAASSAQARYALAAIYDLASQRENSGGVSR